VIERSEGGGNVAPIFGFVKCATAIDHSRRHLIERRAAYRAGRLAVL